MTHDLHLCDHGQGHGAHFCECPWEADHDWQLGFYACNHEMVSD